MLIASICVQRSLGSEIAGRRGVTKSALSGSNVAIGCTSAVGKTTAVALAAFHYEEGYNMLRNRTRVICTIVGTMGTTESCHSCHLPAGGASAGSNEPCKSVSVWESVG